MASARKCRWASSRRLNATEARQSDHVKGARPASTATAIRQHRSVGAPAPTKRPGSHAPLIGSREPNAVHRRQHRQAAGTCCARRIIGGAQRCAVGHSTVGQTRVSQLRVPTLRACHENGVKRQPAFSARRANPTCQAFSQSLARKHNPSDISRLVDLGPMPRFKDMKRSIPGLRSHVLGDGDMKIGVRLSPNE